MNEANRYGPARVHRALISVSDKTGIIELAQELRRFDIEIISTGGTARILREAGLSVTDVSEVTGFPEMMDGRVKTLHPLVHGAVLAVRDNPNHVSEMKEHHLQPIDLVVVNLYPFEETVAREDTTLEDALEQIDIGGPAIIRSAAKNFSYVTVVSSPESYKQIVQELRTNRGSVSYAVRAALALDAFERTSKYDQAVEQYLKRRVANQTPSETLTSDTLPAEIQLRGKKIADLRYGENPHQPAGLYAAAGIPNGIAQARLLHGKEMSFNNYIDADAAWQLVSEFEDVACAIIKHTNPAGAALGITQEDAYRKALAADPVSAFGGIVAFNRPLDKATARAAIEIFIEVVIAPEYEANALEILKQKKNLRLLQSQVGSAASYLEYRQITGGFLAQLHDTNHLHTAELITVTTRHPNERELRDLLFAWAVCKHAKSNAIVYAKDAQTIGVGAGQMSRVDSVRVGAMRAQLPIAGSVLASDGFFPFRDGIDETAKSGVTAVIQPGGSMRDREVIQACEEHQIAMVFTGIRHFKH